MNQREILSLLDEGVAQQRIAPHVAAYIAAELLRVDPRTTGYDDKVRLEEDYYPKPSRQQMQLADLR